MTEWIVSMHATAVSYAAVAKGVTPPKTRASSVRLPEGRTMYFYCKEADRLPSERGWELFRMLTDSPEAIEKARIQATQVVTAGNAVPNYYLWGDDSWLDQEGKASGIFVVGDRHGAAKHIATRSIHWDLAIVLDKVTKPGDSLHWLACRSVM